MQGMMHCGAPFDFNAFSRAFLLRDTREKQKQAGFYRDPFADYPEIEYFGPHHRDTTYKTPRILWPWQLAFISQQKLNARRRDISSLNSLSGTQAACFHVASCRAMLGVGWLAEAIQDMIPLL